MIPKPSIAYGRQTSQLQIRVTPAEKAALNRLANASGESVSGALPTIELELTALLRRLGDVGGDHRSTLAEFERTLQRVPGAELWMGVPAPETGTLSPVLLNCVAAMVETAAHDWGVDPPAWVAEVPPVPRPHFGWVLRSLRPHQLRVTSVAYKRRNIFFDPAVGPSP